MFFLHSKKKVIWNLKYENIFLKYMPENVQPVTYFIKRSRILFNIAHVNHYLLLLMILDFYLEFIIFLKFSYFWTFTLVSIRKIVSFTFLPYLTILALHLPFRNSESTPGLVFKKKPPKKVSSRCFFFFMRNKFL